jgi:hypothetical protein
MFAHINLNGVNSARVAELQNQLKFGKSVLVSTFQSEATNVWMRFQLFHIYHSIPLNFVTPRLTT